MPKVSVIIPVYNTEDYLKECLSSVLNQTFDDFEVICVNDGSTDSSLQILESYCDSGIKIIDQENRGLGAARNAALKQCNGEYVLFLDSDDYLDENALQELYQLASQKSLDLLMYKLINFNNETLKQSKYRYFEMEFLDEIVGDNVFNWHDVKDRIFDMAVTAPAKLFKRDLIKDLKFPENLIFEDTPFFYNVIFRAQRVYFYDNHLYHRRVRKESITNASFKDFSDCIEIYDIVEDDLRAIGVYEEFSVKLFDRKTRDIFVRFKGVPGEFKKDFHTKIKDDFTRHESVLKKEGTLDKCNDKSLAIFKNAISSNTYQEFESKMEAFELKQVGDKSNDNIDKSRPRGLTGFLSGLSDIFKRH